MADEHTRTDELRDAERSLQAAQLAVTPRRWTGSSMSG
jgi:hypothetical protein